MLVSGSEDGTVRLWNSATGGLIKTMSSPNGKMRGVFLTSDGRELVSDNGTIWDFATGRVLVFTDALILQTMGIRGVAWT